MSKARELSDFGGIITVAAGSATLDLTSTEMTFAGAIVSNGRITSESATPSLNLYETDGPTDEKRWQIFTNGGQLQWTLRNDADASSVPFFVVNRTGDNVDSIDFRDGNGTSNLFTLASAGTTLNSNLTINAVGITLTGSTARITIQDTGSPVDNGKYDFLTSSNQIRFRLLNDASSLAGNVFSVSRSGNSITNFSLYGGTAPAIVLDASQNTALKGNQYMENAKIIYGKDTGGTLRACLYPRHSDNRTYLDGGTSGISLRPSNGTVSGLIIDGAGRVTKPNQPAFLAYPNVTQSNMPATATKVNFGAERFDLDANFNTTTSTFVAPITGKYQFNVSIRIDNLDTAMSWCRLRLATSNATYYGDILDPNLTADPIVWQLSMSVIVDMDVNDTVVVFYEQISGAVQADIISNTSTTFSGFLVA